MRIPLYIANWKMHKSVRETKVFFEDFLRLFPESSDREVVICPPFTALACAQSASASRLGIGAQDLFWEPKGAFTGEISPLMLKDLGCAYVLVAHSERRQYFGETDAGACKKVRACFDHGLKPVLCVGETGPEMEAGKTREVLSRQVREGVKGLAQTDFEKLTLAYEPVWAIGTGKADTPPQSNGTIEFIRGILEELAGHHVSRNIRILYGGSVKPANTRSFMEQPEIDGVLVGGASLDPVSFWGIVKS